MTEIDYEINEYLAFPTMIHQFKSKFPVDDMVEYIQSQYNTDKNITQTEPNLQEKAMFNPLCVCIKHVTSDIVRELGYNCDHLEITNMWGNYLKKETSHPPHTHSNNVFSGVYYIGGDEEASPIQFFDPRPQAHSFKPNLNKFTNKNSNMLQFEAEVGTGIIFPSWLMHWVPPTPSERTSISWNIILRGDYGSEKEYQYANI
tara:strand:- start:801 stop:1406 length:606 start_codon:yes stop_codon:yes gene_type:complete